MRRSGEGAFAAEISGRRGFTGTCILQRTGSLHPLGLSRGLHHFRGGDAASSIWFGWAPWGNEVFVVFLVISGFSF